jgi:hypothetical protein
MSKTLFVCYAHGCRGENLSHRISQHEYFCKLEAKTINGRTVITNEHFEKRFLMHPSRVNFSNMHLPTDKNIVVPSHYFVDILGHIYPEAKYISIDVPKNLQEFKQSLYDRFFEYRTNSLLELVGECVDKFQNYNQKADKNDFKKFFKEILKIKNISFGDIHCMARGLAPTFKNKQILLEDMCPNPLTKKTTENSFIVPYENVETISVDEIISYVKK